MNDRESSERHTLNFDAEYRELNNHLRECWRYISDLLKNFIFLQIILISVVFLGGGVVKIEGIDVNTSRSVVENNANPNTHPESASSTRRFRKLAIMPLLLIGIAGSVGAAMQNRRLFVNATYFVRRAAYLEHRGGFAKDGRVSVSERTMPANTYMNENLYSGKKVNLEFLLIAMYGGFAILWMGYTFAFLMYEGLN
jgi:hypothetical protein